MTELAKKFGKLFEAPVDLHGDAPTTLPKSIDALVVAPQGANQQRLAFALKRAARTRLVSDATGTEEALSKSMPDVVVADGSLCDKELLGANRTVKLLTLATIVLPAVGAVCAAALAAYSGVRRPDIILFTTMYVLTMLGITMGYHRLLAHRSFQTAAWVRAVLAILGSMAAQGPVFFWASIHRRHHQRSDQPGDPHSPLTRSPGRRVALAGFWHAHVGWMFAPQDLRFRRLVPDLLGDPILRFIDRSYLAWVALGLAIPAFIGGIWTGTWAGVGYGLLWGGLLRVFVAHHVTWCINSVCHLVGTRPFETRDMSRNNFIVAVLTLGEGWHNNHHASPAAARHGIRWWQLDVVYYTVRLLQAAGIVWNVGERSPRTGREAPRLSLRNQRGDCKAEGFGRRLRKTKRDCERQGNATARNQPTASS